MLDFSYEEVSQIVRASKDTVENNRNYQMLYKGFFKKLWENQVNRGILFSIYISAEAVNHMNFAALGENMSNIISTIAEANLIELDSEGKIIEASYFEGRTDAVKAQISNISLTHYAFFFGKEGITRYINGQAIDDKNIFYSRSDEMSFLEKKDISRIGEVMESYAKEHVTQQINYMCFFADNSTLKQIDSKLVKKNILKNSPEHYMRDQLCQYLTDHMKYTFTIEPELGQSKRELDIFFDVSGELYFIEIKWLGKCVNKEGTGLSSTVYGESRAREGVVQTLEYIEELINTSEKSLRCGYLVIYDARDKKKVIDFQNYNFVDLELRKFEQNFKLLKIVPLDKRHPA